MPILPLFALLFGAQPVDLSPPEFDYLAVTDDLAKPFCENPQHLRATEGLCARKPGVTTTHWRPRTKAKDPTWTVRFDVLSFPSEKEAVLARQQLVALARSPVTDKLTLSWCPRSYFWSADSIVIVSAGCGAQRTVCQLSRGLAQKLVDAGSPEPWGIIGFEGGVTELGRGPLPRCD